MWLLFNIYAALVVAQWPIPGGAALSMHWVGDEIFRAQMCLLFFLPFT